MKYDGKIKQKIKGKSEYSGKKIFREKKKKGYVNT